MPTLQEQRVNKRLKSRGLTIDIDNGGFVVDGYIEDVSFNGMKVTQLPKRFLVQKNNFITVISGNNFSFKVEISPCWIHREFPGAYQVVGFKIINPTQSWKDFINNHYKNSEH